VGTNDTVHSWPRGKLLGGSSAINYMMYGRGQVAEYDDWNELAGLKGWAWKDIQPYFWKHEGFTETVPPSEVRPTDFSFKKEHHGFSGPIKTSFPNFRSTSERAYHEAAMDAGMNISVPQDAWSGNHLGIFANLATIDRSGPGTRSYAVTGYLIPNGQRPNLSVLTDALVERLIIKEGDVPVVEGVVFSHSGKSYQVTSKIATILSAGAVMTPQLLELSGIGSKSILAKADINCIVDNPRVGDLEDHVISGITCDLVDGEYSLDHVNRPEVAAEALRTYLAGKGGPLGNGVSNSGYLSLHDVASKDEIEKIYEIVETYRSTLDNEFDRARSDLLLARLKDPKAATYQIITLAVNIDFAGRHDMQAFLAPSATTTRFSMCIGLHHCFSRGSTHIVSSNPRDQPAINPEYLKHPVDALLLAYGLRSSDKILNTPPMKEKLRQRVQPAPDVDLNDIEAALKYVKSHTGTEFHPIASASLGLVVDERLNVKGVKGLKVCDASIIPLHISGNTQGPCYAIGEKGADMFKEDGIATDKDSISK
jgi:choline dehydrogenase-like flavoprotein